MVSDNKRHDESEGEPGYCQGRCGLSQGIVILWVAVFVSAFLTILTLAPVVVGLGIANDGFALAFMMLMGLTTCLPVLKFVRVLKGERVDRWMF